MRANGNQVVVEYYNRRESTYSDHRPVLGLFSISVRKVDHQKMESIKQQVLANLLAKRSQMITSEAAQPAPSNKTQG